MEAKKVLIPRNFLKSFNFFKICNLKWLIDSNERKKKLKNNIIKFYLTAYWKQRTGAFL